MQNPHRRRGERQDTEDSAALPMSGARALRPATGTSTTPEQDIIRLTTTTPGPLGTKLSQHELHGTLPVQNSPCTPALAAYPVQNSPSTPTLAAYPVHNSPRTPVLAACPVQNSPSSPEIAQFGAFSACRESFIPFSPPRSRAGRVLYRTRGRDGARQQDTRPHRCGGRQQGLVQTNFARNFPRSFFEITRKRCNSNGTNSMFEVIAGELRAKLLRVRPGRPQCRRVVGQP